MTKSSCLPLRQSCVKVLQKTLLLARWMICVRRIVVVIGRVQHVVFSWSDVSRIFAFAGAQMPTREAIGRTFLLTLA